MVRRSISALVSKFHADSSRDPVEMGAKICSRGVTRRGAILGGACVFGHPATAHAEADTNCLEIAAQPKVEQSAEEQERHGIFLRLAMALVFDGWGVDRDRNDLINAYAAAAPGKRFGAYAGHSIGALLVNARAEIICFALNRNVELNSTLEHAEARAIRTAIQIANARRFQTGGPNWSFGNLLRGDRLYSTLEPCAQCAGIMDLANIGTVVFAQSDPSQNNIVNILYNLRHPPGRRTSNDAGGAPFPVPGVFLDVWYDLETAYRTFVAEAPPGSRTGLTSFLETVAAWQVYRDAALSLLEMRPVHQANADILRSAREFRERWRDRVFLGGVPN